MTEIEIIPVEAKEIAISSKITLYCCIWWNNSGVLETSHPYKEKHLAEQLAYQMSKHSNHISIYKFEVDVPQLKQRQ
jgi:hypothetical protein